MARKGVKQADRLADLIGRIIDPVAAKRGFATADLVAAWPDIVGERFADCTRPERLVWPPRDPDEPGVLVLKVDGPVAILVQHEADQIVERVNAFMGYRAVARLRFSQGPVSRPDDGPAGNARAANLAPEDKARLDAALDGVDDDRLKEALARLGRGVLSDDG